MKKLAPLFFSLSLITPAVYADFQTSAAYGYHTQLALSKCAKHSLDNWTASAYGECNKAYTYSLYMQAYAPAGTIARSHADNAVFYSGAARWYAHQAVEDDSSFGSSLSYYLDLSMTYTAGSMYGSAGRF